MSNLWSISEGSFDPDHQHRGETIFTIGNGYLATRGTFEEGYPGERRATFVHGVFDDAPVVLTELANAPDWLALTILINGERFSLASGTIDSYERRLDLHAGLLTRTVRWRSPSGQRIKMVFERFASLSDEHLLCLRLQIVPDFDGLVEFRAALKGTMDNNGLAHWDLMQQGRLPPPSESPKGWLSASKAGDESLQGDGSEVVYLHSRTRRTRTEISLAMRLEANLAPVQSTFWDADSVPTLCQAFLVKRGETLSVSKFVGIATSRDTTDPPAMAAEHVRDASGWDSALEAHQQAWAREWDRCDVQIEGDDEAQLAVRFSLFQLLIAAPRHDNRVNIGAKTLSGYAYAGHCFWDTETFMLPFFIYTAPHIARNLLDYRYHRLPGARLKARANGFDGAQFPWESADTGEEVTPTWVPHYADRTRQIRIWTGDIEIHISADIAHAAHLYWKTTGDDDWFIEKGAELVLDTAKFWASRAEWNAETGSYEYNDVIGPDEYHDHVDNNFYTNYMARWNLQAALDLLDWLKRAAPAKLAELRLSLSLTPELLESWKDVIARMHLPVLPDGLIEQFEGYFQRRDVDLVALEPREISAQMLFGIEGCAETQVLKQPDVLMLQYLKRDDFSDEEVRANYEYYTPRTDHTFGSSLGPSIQAIMACDVGAPEDAYEHFIRAARADLRDVRGNAGDGIHGASAGGTWQAVVFGFAGLRVHADGWTVNPRLPKHWRGIKFHFCHRGEWQTVDIHQ